MNFVYVCPKCSEMDEIKYVDYKHICQKCGMEQEDQSSIVYWIVFCPDDCVPVVGEKRYDERSKDIA